MASFISALSLLVLVLFNGCFTLPIDDEQFSSSTFSSLTNETTFGLQLVTDNATSEFSNMTRNYPSDEHMTFEPTTVTEQSDNDKRDYHDDSLLSSSEPTSTTEVSDTDKRDYHDDLLLSSSEPITTTEESNNDKRDYHDDLLLSTSEPTTYTTESLDTDKRDHEDYLLSFSESTKIIEQSDTDKRDYEDSLFTTIESSTQVPELERRAFMNDIETETETVNDKREMPVELLTNDTFSSTSIPTTVVPLVNTSESSISTSTEKYVGLLKHEKVDEEEEERKPIKPIKKLRKTTPEPEIQSEDEPEEDHHESTVPTAEFDQEGSDKMPNVPVYNMILDENNTLIVTDVPEKFSTTTVKNLKEEKLLNQGEESLHTEKKE